MSVQLITGPMFSGKSSELQRRLRRYSVRCAGPDAHAKAVLIVAGRDTRYAAGTSVTHDGLRATADLVVDDDGLLRALSNADVLAAGMVGIDEGQFLTHLAPVCERLAALGKHVVVAGLSSDFRRRPFRPIAELIGLADEVTRLSAVCHTCGKDAAFTARVVEPKTSGNGVILVGGLETYRAACRSCHPHTAPIPIIVSIEGAPGCGKTSLLRLVQQDKRFEGLAKVVTEDVDAWPAGLLKAYYSDMSRYSALFQLEALAARKDRVLAACGQIPVLIIERSWEADRRCFANLQADSGIMPLLDAAVYRDVSDAVLASELPPLSGALYLQAAPETCLERVRGRGREGERPIDAEYLQSVIDRHDAWLLADKKTHAETAPYVQVVDGNADRDPDSATQAEPILAALLDMCVSLAARGQSQGGAVRCDGHSF